MAGFCLGGEREVLAVCFIGFLGLFRQETVTGAFWGVFAGFLFLPAAFYKSKIYLYRITQTGAAFSAACFAAWLLGKKAVCSYTALPDTWHPGRQRQRDWCYLPGLVARQVEMGLERGIGWKQAAAGVHRYYMAWPGRVAAIGYLLSGW